MEHSKKKQINLNGVPTQLQEEIKFKIEDHLKKIDVSIPLIIHGNSEKQMPISEFNINSLNFVFDESNDFQLEVNSIISKIETAFKPNDKCKNCGKCKC